MRLLALQMRHPVKHGAQPLEVDANPCAQSGQERVVPVSSVLAQLLVLMEVLVVSVDDLTQVLLACSTHPIEQAVQLVAAVMHEIHGKVHCTQIPLLRNAPG